MDEAVDGMQEERDLIFRAFALGLFGNLCTVTAGTVTRSDESDMTYWLNIDFPIYVIDQHAGSSWSRQWPQLPLVL